MTLFRKMYLFVLSGDMYGTHFDTSHVITCLSHDLDLERWVVSMF